MECMVVIVNERAHVTLEEVTFYLFQDLDHCGIFLIK